MSDPTQPNQPTDPTNPAQPVDPTQPPAAPVDPSAASAAPVAPTQPADSYPAPQPNQDPYHQLPPVGQPGAAPARKSATKGIIIGAIVLVVGIAVFLGVRFGLSALMNDTSPAAIAKTVEQLKEQTDLPLKVDEVTTLDDITAEDDAVHYFYTIAGADTTGLTEDALEAAVLPGLCAQKETKALLDRDVRMKYSYVVAETGDEFDLDFGKSDCA